MSIPKRPPKVLAASELVRQLQQDPQYQSRIAETETLRQESIQKHKLAAAPVIQDLKKAGFTVESFDELRRSGVNYLTAIPLLVKWLPVVAEITVKDSIVRTLSIPQAALVAARPLIIEFLAATGPESGLKWTIGNALAVIADDNVFDEVVELVRNRKHGKSREMLAVALGNMKNPAAVDVLIELLGDDEVAGYALMGLAKLKAEKSRPHIERLLNHSKPWVRKEAKKTLSKLK